MPTSARIVSLNGSMWASTPTTHKLSPSFVGSVLVFDSVGDKRLPPAIIAVLDGPSAFLADRPEAGPYTASAIFHLTYKQQFTQQN